MALTIHTDHIEVKRRIDPGLKIIRTMYLFTQPLACLWQDQRPMTDEASPADRVRTRVKHWLDVTKLGQRQFARDVGKTQVWLQKVLTEGDNGNDVRLRDLDTIALAMRTTASELVRTSEEYYALELTPTELRVIEQLRRRPELLLAVATILGVGLPTTGTALHQPREASPLRRKVGRPRTSTVRKGTPEP